MKIEPSSNRSALPNYGIDAPILVGGFAVTGMAGCVLAVALIFGSKVGLPPWTRFGVLPAISMGVSFLLTAAVMLWGSLVGKLRLRDKVIASIPWCGEERVLDVGCGHGLMLIGAAKQLRNGNAVGIDLWQSVDQAGNSREATWQNVERENVSDRVELIDGDARALPFADDHFDVVLSSWALHNIYDRSGRDTAIQEVIRVLKPGGRLVIIDIRHTAEYAQVLRASGMIEIHRGRANFLFFIPSHTLTACKSNRRL
jgi:arsenite methyltransferase